MPDVQTLFKRHFGYPAAHVARSPVWLELLGTAAVDDRGLALAVAVDRYVHLASAPRSDGKIELLSSWSPKPVLFWMSQLEPTANSHWLDCIKSLLNELRRRNVHFSGFNAAIYAESDLELALQREHSYAAAALQVATALTVRQLHPFRLTETGATVPPRRNSKGQLPPLEASEKISIARLCHDATPKRPGIEPTLLGPLTCLFGKAWHILSVDLQSQTVERIPLVGEVFVQFELASNSPPAAPGPNAEFENRAYSLSAARKLRARSLRALELKSVEANKHKLTPREYECARHFTAELQRMVAVERALREDDHRQFGQYLLDSYKSARKLSAKYESALDLLVEIAVAHPGCLGARARNSAVLSIVNFHQVQRFMSEVPTEFSRRTGQTARTRLFRSADGANG